MKQPKWATESIRQAKKNGWDATFKNGFAMLTRPEGSFKIVVQSAGDGVVKVEIYKFSGGSYTSAGKISEVVPHAIAHAEYMLSHKKMGSRWMKYSLEQLKIACGDSP